MRKLWSSRLLVLLLTVVGVPSAGLLAAPSRPAQERAPIVTLQGGAGVPSESSSNPEMHPQDGPEAERCDGIDNNGDGSIDEGFDRDGDGTTTCQGDAEIDTDANLPGYQRGVLVLKIKPGVSLDPPPPSLDALNQKWGYHGRDPVFEPSTSTDEGINAIRARFSVRTKRSLDPLPASGLDRYFKFYLRDDADIEQAAREYATDPYVEDARINGLIQSSFVPNDQYYNAVQQWGLFSIQMSTAWNTANGSGVRIAIVDTGVNRTHPDLLPNMYVSGSELVANSLDDDGNGKIDDPYGWDFITNSASILDASGHGTHVAGIAAAVANNTSGIAGVAFGATIIPVRVLGPAGGTWTDVAAGINYADASGADVINLSLGGLGSGGVVEAAVNAAHLNGVVVICAAGNDNAETYLYLPTGVERSLSVSAFTQTDVRASFSSFGVKLDVAAPGGDAGVLNWNTDIFSTVAPGSALAIGGPTFIGSDGAPYHPNAGTSMAAPHVAGLAALLIQLHPAWTNEEIRQAIRRSANDVMAIGIETDSGHGRINAANAVALPAIAPPHANVLTPANGTTVPGALSPTSYPITGYSAQSTALPGFASRTLEIGAGQVPGSWTTFATGSGQVYAGPLGTLDTTLFQDGTYVVRVKTTASNSVVSEDRNLVFVDNIYISNPIEMQVLTGGTYSVQGRAPSYTGFSNYQLSWAPGCPVSGAFTVFHNSVTGVGNSGTPATLGPWNVSLVPDGLVTLRLQAFYGAYQPTDDVCVVVDKLMAPGWPVPINHLPSFKSPKIANLDGLGDKEIVVGASVFNSNGAVRAGWTNFPGLGRTNPAVTNIDGGIDLEVVVAEFQAYYFDSSYPNNGAPIIKAYRHDKTLLWSYPVTVPVGGPPGYNNGVPSSIAIGDVDNDGFEEVIFSVYFSYYQPLPDRQTWVFVLDALTGALENSFPLVGASYASLAVADINQNGDDEIIVETYRNQAALGRVYVVTETGTNLPGWPVDNTFSGQEGFLSTDPVVADLDRDGTFEIFINKLSFEINGALSPTSWPFCCVSRSTGAPVPLEDNECKLEVATGGGNSVVTWAGEDTGTLLWAKNTSGQNLFVIMAGENGLQGNAVVADIDGDGKSEVLKPAELGYTTPNTPMPIYGIEGTGPFNATNFPRYVLNNVSWYSDPLRSTVAIGDIDNDGLTDMVVLGGGQVYRWLLGTGFVATNNVWPEFQHDLHNTGTLPPTPIGIEICNGLDDDCDGLVDEGFVEICNGLDDDCDGSIDEGFDVDGDGYTTCGGDCNDNNAAVNPGATEVCNGIDDNCDGIIDNSGDISVRKLGPTGLVSPGATISFTITITNIGGCSASNIVVNDLLPPGLQYQSHTISPFGSYNPFTGNIFIPNLGPSQSTTLTLYAVVDSCFDIVNCATLISLTGTDSNASNNQSCYQVHVNPQKCGRIFGKKYEDKNRNGIKDGIEPFIAGQTIKLTDPFSNVSTQSTGALGDFLFNPEPPMSYQVSEVLQPGQVVITPPSGSYSVVLPPGGSVGSLDFGNYICKPSGPANCIAPPSGMVEWWPLDVVVGVSGLCNYTPGIVRSQSDEIFGAPVGATACGATPPGARQGAINFDGIDDYVEANVNIASLDFPAATGAGVGDFSIDAWIRTTSAQTQVIVDKRQESSGPVQGYSFFTSSGRLFLQLANAGAITNYDSGVTVNNNLWRHVTVTVDRDSITGLRFYVDGALVSTQNPTGRAGTLINGKPLRIGRRSDNGGGFFRGGIDEVEVFRRVLTATEVFNIFNVGKCKHPTCSTPATNSLCLNQSQKTVPFTICNWGSVPDTFHWSMAPLPTGVGCTAPGPTTYLSLSGVTAVLTPGQCTTFNVTITQPPGFVPPQTSCYQMTFVGDSTGDCWDCKGRLRKLNLWCINMANPHLAGVKRVVFGTEASVSVKVSNSSEQRRTLDYQWLVSQTGEPSISLNGLPPGQPVRASITLDPGESADVPVTVRYQELDALRFDDLEFQTDIDEDGTLEATTSVALRSITEGSMPFVCEGELPGDGLTLSWASATRLTWNGESCAAVYNAYRRIGGPMVDRDGDGLADDYGRCLMVDQAGTELSDTAVPPAGDTHYYLVTAENETGEGSLGRTSAGLERPNYSPCP